MIVYNVALALLTMAYAGTNNSALGLDASRFDLNARSNHVETEDHPTLAIADCGHVGPEESTADAGVDEVAKRAGLRGLINAVHTNASTETGSDNADRTVPAAEIWIERSKRLVARPTMSFMRVPTRHPFTTNSELRTAIQEYLNQGCPRNENCDARSKYGGAIGDWRVSNLPDFSYLFYDGSWNPVDGADSFNEPLNWNTGSATNMQGMFELAAAFNQDLSAFDTAKVENMSGMFRDAYAFNQPLPAKFDTAKVEDMDAMFYNAAAFNQPLPAKFDTAKVTSMSGMFYGAVAFNQPLPAKFDTSKVTSMGSMFRSATAFNQQLPATFNTAKVENMSGMFDGAAAFNQPLSSFDTSSVTYMSYMFWGATAFNQDLCHFGDNWPHSSVFNMFADSGCASTSKPEGVNGPWCASTCPSS